MTRRLAALAPLLAAQLGCSEPAPGADAAPDAEVEPRCAEADPEIARACDDGCDNDGDGLVDCDDPDCDVYCCEVLGPEPVACDDGCDNDRNGRIDCEDYRCEDSSACRVLAEDLCGDGPGPCCDDGQDGDGDGLVDCADPDCAGAVGCCPLRLEHREEPDGQLDPSLWVPLFGSSWPAADDEGWLERFGPGARSYFALPEPLSIADGFEVSFTVRTAPPVTTCTSYRRCPHLLGVVLSPSLPEERPEWLPDRSLMLLVTPTDVFLVGGSRILRQIAIEPLADGHAVTRRIGLRVVPSSAGLRVEARVEYGRSTSLDARAYAPEEVFVLEPERVPEGLGRLDSGGRGAYLLLVGEGSEVRLSDGPGRTLELRDLACPARGAWSWTGRHDVIDETLVCWALDGVGAPSVAPLADGRLAMALEGATLYYTTGWEPPATSIALLHGASAEAPSWVDEAPFRAELRRPVDTEYDLNCSTGGQDWVGAECEAVPNHPSMPPGGCEHALGHRGPAIAQSCDGRLLFVYAEDYAGRYPGKALRVAQLDPERWLWLDDYREGFQAGALDDLSGSASRRYFAIRDPEIHCAVREASGACPEGEYLVLAVVDAARMDEEGEWLPAGNDVVVVGYAERWGFSHPYHVLLSGDEGGPLEGREVASPTVVFDEARGLSLLFLTERVGRGPSQLSLYFATYPEWRGIGPALSGDLRRHGASPLLVGADLPALLADELGPAVDCSEPCDIGGTTALVVPGSDLLHLWVEVRPPVLGWSRRRQVHHLTSPLALPY